MDSNLKSPFLGNSLKNPVAGVPMAEAVEEGIPMAKPVPPTQTHNPIAPAPIPASSTITVSVPQPQIIVRAERRQRSKCDKVAECCDVACAALKCCLVVLDCLSVLSGNGGSRRHHHGRHHGGRHGRHHGHHGHHHGRRW